jgi:hypothetical protein
VPRTGVARRWCGGLADQRGETGGRRLRRVLIAFPLRDVDRVDLDDVWL